LALLSSIAILASPARAGSTIVQGYYAVEARYWTSLFDYKDYGCMIVGNGGNAEVPSLYDWGSPGAYCGLSSYSAQARWQIYAVRSTTTGKTGHVIKSAVNGKCLIRGASGQATFASLYLWPLNADHLFCGFRTADELIENGQAAWDLSDFEPIVVNDLIVYSGTAKLTLPNSALNFSPLPATAPSRVDGVSNATFGGSGPPGWYIRLHTWPD
jgi:hypothetical protein